MKRVAELIVVGVLALTACTGESANDSAQPPVGQDGGAAKPPSANALAIGQTFKTSEGTFAVLSYKPDLSLPDGPRVALQVKACADAPGLEYGETNWKLLRSDGSQVDSTWLNSTPPELSPVVPVSAEIPVGECASGWLFFQKEDGASTARVQVGSQAGRWDLTRTM